jgi:O-antigen/teichoic acid export membrane protein
VFKQFLKDSVVYGMASILVRSLSLLLVPLYTRALVPADYGVIDLLAAFTTFVNFTVALEVSQAVARYLPDAKSPAEREGYASTSFWWALGAYGAFTIVAWPLAGQLSTWLFNDSHRSGVFDVALVATWINGLFLIVQSQLRYSLKPRAYTIASLVFAFASMATSVLFVLVLRQGVIGVIYGQVAGGIIGLVTALYLSREVYGFRFDTGKLAVMLRFSVPLVPSSVGVFVCLYMDRIAIEQLMTLTDVGLFGIGYRVASVTSLLMVAFVAALTPLIYTHYRDPATPPELARIFRYFTALGIGFCLGLSLFAHDILKVIATSAYIDGAIVVPFLAPALLLANMYIFAPGLGIAKRTSWIAAINIGGAAANVVLNYMLVPYLGIRGAALSTLLCNIAIFGATMVASQRFYPVPHDWRRLGLAVAAGVGLFVLGDAVLLTGIVGIAFRFCLLGVAGAVCLQLRLVELGDVRTAAKKIRDVFSPSLT